MRELCRHTRGRTVLPLMLLSLAGCGPSRAELKDRQEQAKYHYDLAYGYFFNKNNPQGNVALLQVLKSLELKEENADAHLLAGLIFQGRARHLDAIGHYKRALEINPDLYFATNNMATTYLSMERWDDAIPLLKSLVTNVLYNRQGHAQNNLGWAYYKKGNLPKANEHFSNAIFTAEKLCPPYNNLGIVYIDQKQYARAEKYLRRGLKRCPNYAEPYFHLGRTLVHQGKAKDARQSFTKCLKYAGETPLADRCERRLRSLPAGDAR